MDKGSPQDSSQAGCSAAAHAWPVACWSRSRAAARDDQLRTVEQEGGSQVCKDWNAGCRITACSSWAWGTTLEPSSLQDFQISNEYNSGKD